ncbi:hypothetical protein [Cupriavidus necator]|uniref:hypothetical protein n=1 Tax=Cupriavidus necator TaxID=106590 RepID=UPI0019D280AE
MKHPNPHSISRGYRRDTAVRRWPVLVSLAAKQTHYMAPMTKRNGFAINSDLPENYFVTSLKQIAYGVRAASKYRVHADIRLVDVRCGLRLALVGTAGGTIEEMTAAMAQVSRFANEIAAASGEQSNGIEPVNMAVGRLDQVTQQNAALVEEASAATQSMSEQARALREAVAVFRLGGQGMATA